MNKLRSSAVAGLWLFSIRVFAYDSHAIAFIFFDGRAGHRAVKTPEIVNHLISVEVL